MRRAADKDIGAEVRAYNYLQMHVAEWKLTAAQQTELLRLQLGVLEDKLKIVRDDLVGKIDIINDRLGNGKGGLEQRIEANERAREWLVTATKAGGTLVIILLGSILALVIVAFIQGQAIR